MLNLLGPVIGAVGGLFGGMQQNAANAAAADKQMAFQKEMSDTSYQRGVKDMRAAGINPMLAISQGGASSAAGASYNATNVGEAAVRGAEAGTNSAVKSSMLRSQIDNLKADTALKGETAKAQMAAVVSSMAQAQLANENSATVAALRPWNVGTASAQSGMAMNDLIASNIMGDYVKSDPGRVARTLALGGKDAAEASSALRNFSLGNLLGGTTTEERVRDPVTGDSFRTTRRQGWLKKR